MRSKDETAQFLAEAHFALDPSITRIFRVVGSDDASNARSPIKLLEISKSTPEVGISPVAMTAEPERDILHASIVIEISPAELERLQRGELSLPHGWTVAGELQRPAPARAAS